MAGASGVVPGGAADGVVAVAADGDGDGPPNLSGGNLSTVTVMVGGPDGGLQVAMLSISNAKSANSLECSGMTQT